jgi:predicted acyltransferase
VRASILFWSTASGVILGVFLDATLIGVALLLSSLFPALANRLHHRWLGILAAVILVAVPVVLAVLGYLEGELKTI